MSKSLRILLLEDNPADAELIRFELEEAGIPFSAKVVASEKDFLRELRESPPDLILSDHDLPGYSGTLALGEARSRCPDTPFILVTGAIGEDRAIEVLTRGAKDYVLKSRLQQRLAPAVQRALAEAEEHRIRKQAEAELLRAHRTLEEKVRIRTAELEEMAKEIGIIAEIGKVIGSTLNTEEVYEKFTAEVKKLIPVERVVISHLHHGETRGRTVAYVSGIDGPVRRQGDFVPLAGSVNEEVIRTRRGVIVQSVQSDDPVPRFPSLAAAEKAGVRSHMCVPLLNRDELVGTLILQSTKPAAYNAEDLVKAERIGVQIAGSIANGRLFNELKQMEALLRRTIEEQERSQQFTQRLSQEATILADIGRVISSSLDINEVYAQFAAKARKLISFDRIVVNLENDDKDTRTVVYAAGLDVPHRRPGDRLPADGSMNETLARTRKGLIVQATNGEDIVARFPTLHVSVAVGLRSMLGVPLISRDRVIGNLHFQSKTPNAYTEEDLRLAERIGAQIAGAVANAELFKELKNTEASLRDSEERYRTLFTRASDGILILSLDGELLEVNEAYAAMNGYSAREIQRMRLEDLDTPESARLLPERMRRILAGESLTFEVEHRHKDGHVFPLEVSASLVSYGGKSYIQSFHRDISDRRKAEEALKESLRTSHDLVHAIPSGLYIYQFEEPDRLVLILGNPAAERQTGLANGAWIGREFNEIWPEARSSGITDRYLEVMRTGKPFETEELSYKDNRLAGAFRIHAFALPGKRLAVAFENVTARKQAEEEKRLLVERLHRAEKMEALGQLAGGVAHDLNNVLGILSGYSELLLHELPEGSRSRAHAEKILRSTERGAAIIQDLLTLARRGVSASDVINLNQVVSGFLNTPAFENLKDYHPRVTFRTEYDATLLNIKGSPVHLEKTVMNLLSNAAEAISGEGEVTIRTENRYLDTPIRGYDEVTQGDYVVLTVSDTGMGIPPESREKIFEPFYTKKAMGRSGTGLGLSIVWGTVKDHNGYIDVLTEEGRGTTFTLYFPVAREEMTAPQRKTPVEQYLGKGESVLVVDDIAEQREVASSLLTRLGYDVHVAASGEEALGYLRQQEADVLVLDMIMAPGMDGLETYRKVLEIRPGQKAILVSGFSETDRVREAQKLGAGAYVKKPYVMEKIGIALRNELWKDHEDTAKEEASDKARAGA